MNIKSTACISGASSAQIYERVLELMVKQDATWMLYDEQARLLNDVHTCLCFYEPLNGDKRSKQLPKSVTFRRY